MGGGPRRWIRMPNREQHNMQQRQTEIQTELSRAREQSHEFATAVAGFQRVGVENAVNRQVREKTVQQSEKGASEFERALESDIGAFDRVRNQQAAIEHQELQSEPWAFPQSTLVRTSVRVAGQFVPGGDAAVVQFVPNSGRNSGTEVASLDTEAPGPLITNEEPVGRASTELGGWSRLNIQATKFVLSSSTGPKSTALQQSILQPMANNALPHEFAPRSSVLAQRDGLAVALFAADSVFNIDHPVVPPTSDELRLSQNVYMMCPPETAHVILLPNGRHYRSSESTSFVRPLNSTLDFSQHGQQGQSQAHQRLHTQRLHADQSAGHVPLGSFAQAQPGEFVQVQPATGHLGSEGQPGITNSDHAGMTTGDQNPPPGKKSYVLDDRMLNTESGILDERISQACTAIQMASTSCSSCSPGIPDQSTADPCCASRCLSSEVGASNATDAHWASESDQVFSQSKAGTMRNIEDKLGLSPAQCTSSLGDDRLDAMVLDDSTARRKKIRPSKNSRLRYHTFMNKVMNQILLDPQKFDFDLLCLPKWLERDEDAQIRLKANFQEFQACVLRAEPVTPINLGCSSGIPQPLMLSTMSCKRSNDFQP